MNVALQNDLPFTALSSCYWSCAVFSARCMTCIGCDHPGDNTLGPLPLTTVSFHSPNKQTRTDMDILLMAPRIKLIVICNLLWNEFDKTNATFRSASTNLDHALVVCDLTQIPAE